MKALSLTALLLCTACQAPQWRVGQAKVPEPLFRPVVQVEAERAAARLLAETITSPPEMLPVAQALSASLGQPADPVIEKTLLKAQIEALSSLRAGIVEAQEELVDHNAALAKFQGKKVEGTGVNLFGFAVSLPVLGLVALCILCPGAIGVLFWLLRQTRGALVSTVQGIQNFKTSNPQIAQDIVEKLDRAQDEAHKTLVRKIKSKIKS